MGQTKEGAGAKGVFLLATLFAYDVPQTSPMKNAGKMRLGVRTL